MKISRNLLLLFCSLIFGLFAVEFLSRHFIFDPGHYYPFKPYTSWTFELSREVSPTAAPPTKFTTNRYGIRGDEPSEEDRLRILVLGGSTAENLYVDDSDAWPSQLQKRLRAHPKGAGVWVGNAGKSGIRVYENVMYMRHFIPQIEGIRYVLVLAGSNDLGVALGMASIKSWTDDQRLRNAFQYVPAHHDQGFPYDLSIYGVIGELRARFDKW